MTNIKIVTDSSCTMPKNLCNELDIHVIPLSTMINGSVYKDNVELSTSQFMKMMASSPSLPKTSQPAIGAFVELYDRLGADGSEILSIHMAHSLSGTVEAARQASRLTNRTVSIVDSDFTDQGLAFQVIQAARLSKKGEQLKTIINKIEHIREHTKLFIGISTLDNLVKGGRISRAKGLFSSLLNMKIVLELTHTELIPVSKGRGTKTFYRWFEHLKKDYLEGQNVCQIGISYAGDFVLPQTFKEELQTLFPTLSISVLPTNSVIATHTGNDAFAIMYYTS